MCFCFSPARQTRVSAIIQSDTKLVISLEIRGTKKNALQSCTEALDLGKLASLSTLKLFDRGRRGAFERRRATSGGQNDSLSQCCTMVQLRQRATLAVCNVFRKENVDKCTPSSLVPFLTREEKNRKRKHGKGSKYFGPLRQMFSNLSRCVVVSIPTAWLRSRR